MVDLSSQQTERAVEARPSRLPSLTGMRFIAAIMVFMFHAMDESLFTSSHAQRTFESIFAEGGWAGVGFFFVLSGFVLTWSAKPNDTARAFWRRRFWKVYPNHLCTFIVAAVLLGVVSDQVFDPGHAVLNLLLLQAWFPQLPLNNTFNTVSWSLSCEALFYLSFPLLIGLIRRIRPARLWAWAGVVVGVIFLVPIIGIALPHQPFLAFANASQDQLWFTYFFPPVRLLDFVFGILLARIVMSGQRVPLGPGGAATLCVAAYVLAPRFPLTYPLVAVTVVPLGLLIAAGAVADVEGRQTVVSSRVMVWLGEISFAFYLCHRLVLVYGHQLLGTTWSTPAAIGVLVVLSGATLLVAWGLYRLVEWPLMRRFSKRRRPAAAAAPAFVEG
jgi:peptidoglycan/LPS O-acetylase OafA/YrhL